MRRIDFQKRQFGLPRFIEKEDGSATIISLYFTLIFVVVGGLAIDFNKVMAERTQLQVAADSVAHAALYSRENMTAAEAISKSMEVADVFLPYDSYGSALTARDVEFGVWDGDTNTFFPSAGSRSAVRVTSQMTSDRQNPSYNLLLRIVGQDTWDLTRTSVYTTYLPPCFTEGFVAEDVVDIQSNNAFGKGFCVHSNTYVSLNSNNFFEPGSIVQMPNLDDLDMPSSGLETNEGLSAALRQGEYRLRVLNKMESMIDGMKLAEAESLPEDFVNPPIDSLFNNRVTPADFNNYSVTEVFCGGSNKLTFDGGTYSNLVITTGCDIKFNAGVILENVRRATTSTDKRSFNAPSGLQIGRNDNCAEGGGSVLMTMGGFEVAADLQAYGSQILAQGDVSFAANANGIEGISIVAGGRIDGTSNMDMGFCEGDGQTEIVEANYFRMVD